MYHCDLISAHHNLHQKHGIHFILAEILQKTAQRAADHIIGKGIAFCPWKASDNLHILIYTEFLDIRRTVVFLFIQSQHFHNVSKMIHHHLEKSAVYKLNALLIQCVMLYAVLTISSVILNKPGTGNLPLKEKTPQIITVDFIWHFINIGILF